MSKKMTVKKIAYCWRRTSRNGGLLFDTFVLVDESLDDLISYKAARRCRFIIGQIYNGKIDDDHTIDFQSFETIDDDRASNTLIDEWSAEDAAARRTKLNESARKKLQAEYRNKWLEKLEPLRRQYQGMTACNQRAMRQLLLEWIGARP